ncbi:hypothetical protein [Planctomycetes bacterium K23_9]|uniref:Chain length determinant protein n=1 Tax=Stieleria marina TaxID=1930275 RepID=A0A517P110_9BACT|nr:Chain length determinant protein [Planctomycetes bacterium K23_9]
MSATAPIPWKHVRNVLVLFAPLWIGATLVFGVCGVGYALVSKDKYSARQPLVVRDEATGSVDRLGRFPSQTELKAAQETILEMVQNPEVVSNALVQIGPPSPRYAENWPSRKAVDATIKSSVNLVAPKGSEFGNTEVVYLEVQSSDQDRAKEFCRAMYDNLTQHLRNVRRVRADSIISELYHVRDLAKENLDEASARMREVEIKFGTDLSELRNLNDSIAGDGATRRALEKGTSELQLAEKDLRKLHSLHELLVAGVRDTDKMLISGSDLLTSQPSLLRLKDGLIAAQLRSSELSGNYKDSNPKRRAAIATEGKIRQQMQQEIEAVIAGMEPRLALAEREVERLETKKQKLIDRLGKLAVARTDYAKIDAEVKHRTQMLGHAEQALTEAQASRSAALSTNLVAELGPPQVNDNPVGPSGTILAAGSSMAGLLFGLGAVFLIAPGPTESHGRRRWSDYLSGQGRRDSDTETVDRRMDSHVGK